MADERSKILERMVERLYASLSSGPVLNCRPHSSRQRIDLSAFAAVDGSTPQALVAQLLGSDHELKVTSNVEPPGGAADDESTSRAWSEQQAVFKKLRTIAEDAKTYEQDTGAQALFVGFPLLQLPADPKRAGRFGSKKILAPIAFVPVSISMRQTRPQSVRLRCSEEGADRVIPNAALLAWIEQQTGKRFSNLFADEEGTKPWEEINDLVSKICGELDIAERPTFGPETVLTATPKSDDDDAREPRVLPCAVLGLYPVSNQNLLRDLEAFVDGEKIEGPLESFLRAGVGLGRQTSSAQREIRAERLVTSADPCQARAVRVARSSTGLVVHGPPGTGKSQTIANIIGDHLARGERVLFVCDKRTALDVVHHRLSRLGIGHFCAVVHDAQRDQRDLYKGIREQLDALPEAQTNARAVAQLSEIDDELTRLHKELTAHHAALATRKSDGAEPSLHEVAGEWFEIPVSRETECVREIADAKLSDLIPLEREVKEVLERGLDTDYPANPWREASDLSLTEYLEQPVDHHRDAVDSVWKAARGVEETANAAIPAFDPDVFIETQIDARERLVEKLTALQTANALASLARWADAPANASSRASSEMMAVSSQLAIVETAPLDPELAVVLRTTQVALGELVIWLAKLAAYALVARKWYRWFCFGRKKDAASVLQRFGLGLGAAATERAAKFLEGVRARRILRDCYSTALAPSEDASKMSDEEIARAFQSYKTIFECLAELDAGGLGSASSDIRRRMKSPEAIPDLIAGLRASRTRAMAIRQLDASLNGSKLLSPRFRQEVIVAVKRGDPALSFVAPLQQTFRTLEGVLRIRRSLGQFPKSIAAAVEKLADQKSEIDVGWNAVRRGVLAGEIARRLKDHPELHDMDPARLGAAHERYASLEDKKRTLVRDLVLHVWTSRQRERLLAGTGSRLNSAGAELRRRLMLRGEHAMRVRQVVAAGAEIADGDPLFDVRPVWMASPETVAQIFPRKAIFDVVVFDEASQCKLEEALPVLTRARRVVIAGDPKQLPPTRFFESAVTRSQEEENDLTEQGLFEEQQAEVEDLLGAALNLEIEQCYLDVHYRSQNSDLISFSNNSFYDARLQAIPGHPNRRAKVPPIKLVRIQGVYEKRANVLEAKEVVRVVRELLGRERVPSIGIACFNLVQRDAIVQALDEAAAADPVFAGQLATARSRQGSASFEGLFVKNLENVQGDERDHMVISTTYGPDAKGRFYRRFGPLGLAGGGRRLNVLVTRAREEVHLVTSIPREIYTSLPPPDPGRSPNGAWLLLSYIAFAEQLGELYRKELERVGATKVDEVPTVRILPTEVPSKLATAVAHTLAAASRFSSEVHWGNDGFCVDVAVQHPTKAEDVTVGVLCDGSRYTKAEDPVEWEMFRTRVLRSQGWELVRLLTPQLFRDAKTELTRVKERSDAVAKQPDARSASVQGPTPILN